jgi:hypothetical protein
MKTKKFAVSLPLLACLVLGISSIAAPFLLAGHYVSVYAGDSGANKYNVDNYIFFLWGKYYTVVGTQNILSRTIMYDLGDFPVYAMIMITVAIIMAAASLFTGRGLVANVKGKVLKLKMDINPLWFQGSAFALLLLSYVYLQAGVKMLDTWLLHNDYEVQTGISLDLLMGSIVALAITLVMTVIKSRKEKGKVIPSENTVGNVGRSTSSTH